MKKNIAIICLTLLVAACVYVLCCVFVPTKEQNFELCAETNKAIVNKGEEVCVDVWLKNKSVLTHAVGYSADIILFYVTKKGEDFQNDTVVSDKNVKLFWGLQSVSKEIKYVFDDVGEYEIVVYSDFDIKDKNYKLEKTITVIVV